MDFSQSVGLSSIKRIVLNQLHVKNFLRGKESKVINTFKLNGLRNFGVIKKIYYKQLQSFLNELIKEEILSVDKENYNAISIINSNVDDGMCKNIFSNFVAINY